MPLLGSPELWAGARLLAAMFAGSLMMIAVQLWTALDRVSRCGRMRPPFSPRPMRMLRRRQRPAAQQRHGGGDEKDRGKVNRKIDDRHVERVVEEQEKGRKRGDAQAAE